jgi:hypothetical protein
MRSLRAVRQWILAAALVAVVWLPASAAAGWAHSGHVTYTFVGGAGNTTLDVSWSGGRYLIRSDSGEFLFADFAIRNRIYVCAPSLQKLKTGAWPNHGPLRVCAQYRTTGNNIGLIEADNELAHYFDPRKNYLPKGLRIAQRTYVGVVSDCYAGGDSREKTRDDTVCVAHVGNYLTYMDIPNARWTAVKSRPVDQTQLALPKGVKVLSLSQSATIIP